MRELVEHLVKHVVDKPEEVQINEISGEQTLVFEMRVNGGDMGKVIGRHGQMAKSLRILLAAVAAKQGKRFILEILEDEKKDVISSQL